MFGATPQGRGQEVEFNGQRPTVKINYVYVTKPQYKTLKKGFERASGEHIGGMAGGSSREGMAAPGHPFIPGAVYPFRLAGLEL